MGLMRKRPKNINLFIKLTNFWGLECVLGYVLVF